MNILQKIKALAGFGDKDALIASLQKLADARGNTIKAMELENRSLKVEVSALRRETAEQPNDTLALLTKLQMGSYLPNLVSISKQSDEFKSALYQACWAISQTPQWDWLMTQLKQDQVNMYLFEEEHKSEDFMRGTINGIWVVEEQVRAFASSRVAPTPDEGN